MKKTKKIITSIVTSALLASMSACAVMGETAADAELTGSASEAEFDPAGTYHAAMGIQTCNTLWICRPAYYDAGLNKTYGTDLYNSLWGGDPSADGATYTGTFTDIELAGNGTYSVKLEGADFAGETAISQLYVATDIPLNEDIKVTDFTVNINGKNIVTFPEAELEDEEDYTVGGMLFLAMNHWRSNLVNRLSELGVEEDASSGITLLTGAGNDNVTLTFTISGFSYDKTPSDDETTPADDGEAASAESTPAAASNEASSDDSGNFPVVPVVIGSVVVVAAVIAIIVTVSKKKKK